MDYRALIISLLLIFQKCQHWKLNFLREVHISEHKRKPVRRGWTPMPICNGLWIALPENVTALRKYLQDLRTSARLAGEKLAAMVMADTVSRSYALRPRHNVLSAC